MGIELVLYLLCGLFAGSMAGLLGIGGGVVVVPVLSYIFSHSMDVPSAINMHMAAGTALAVMVVTSGASILSHLRYGEVVWSLLKRALFFIAIGTMGGVLLSAYIPTTRLKQLFGLFLCFMMLTMVWPIKKQHTQSDTAKRLNGGVSFSIGVFSGLLGLGGGTMLIPYLKRKAIPVRSLAGLGALCSLTVALVGSLAVVLAGLHVAETPDWSLGYVYLPAVLVIACSSAFSARLAAKVAYKMPVKLLHYCFVFFLLFTSFEMMF